MQRSTVGKLFMSSDYKGAAERAAQGVDKAVRRAMDEAQLQGMEDAAKTRESVSLLLDRRCAGSWEGACIYLHPSIYSCHPESKKG